MIAPQAGDDQEARLINGACWDLHEGGISPESLNLQDVDAVLEAVGIALEGVKLKIQPGSNLYRFGGRQPSFRIYAHDGPNDAALAGAPCLTGAGGAPLASTDLAGRKGGPAADLPKRPQKGTIFSSCGSTGAGGSWDQSWKSPSSTS